MKTNIKRGVVFFLVGLMIMQVCFTGASKYAKADHSDNATLAFLPVYLYSHNSKVDRTLPSPFNSTFNSRLYSLTIKDHKHGYNEPSYCIGFVKGAKKTFIIPKEKIAKIRLAVKF